MKAQIALFVILVISIVVGGCQQRTHVSRSHSSPTMRRLPSNRGLMPSSGWSVGEKTARYQMTRPMVTRPGVK